MPRNESRKRKEKFVVSVVKRRLQQKKKVRTLKKQGHNLVDIYWTVRIVHADTNTWGRGLTPQRKKAERECVLVFFFQNATKGQPSRQRALPSPPPPSRLHTLLFPFHTILLAHVAFCTVHDVHVQTTPLSEPTIALQKKNKYVLAVGFAHEGPELS